MKGFSIFTASCFWPNSLSQTFQVASCKKPWTKYSKKQKLDEHANVTLCKYHDVAELAAKTFSAVETGERANAKYAAAGMTKDVAEVRELVKQATVIIAMAAKQNMLHRGHQSKGQI